MIIEVTLAVIEVGLMIIEVMLAANMRSWPLIDWSSNLHVTTPVVDVILGHGVFEGLVKGMVNLYALNAIGGLSQFLRHPYEAVLDGGKDCRGYLVRRPRCVIFFFFK